MKLIALLTLLVALIGCYQASQAEKEASNTSESIGYIKAYDMKDNVRCYVTGHGLSCIQLDKSKSSNKE